ncbi:porin Omp33-36 [Acinetobacter brisouii]|uniref:porin Omp33-36 n=1 Tax=Acinetobacter brisouii TaxID=396323 RepID=UPI0005F8624B|nr:porin Omp33-36 [Acinetobacter brisouii]KJV39432.1 membrane protein [Acinetobacter brisouii]
MKKIGLAAAVLLAMTGAHAYQFEVKGQSEYLDINSSANDKNYTGDLQGTYYFKNVDASKGPLAEAAFLNQASNVSLGYHYGQYNYASGTNPNFNYQDNSYGLKGEAYFTTAYTGSLPLYTSASYNHTSLNGKNAISRDNEGDRYAVEVGALPAKNFLMAVGYTHSNPVALDTSDALAYGAAKAYGESTFSDNKDFVTARAKYVGAIDNTNMSIGFEAKGIFNNDRGAYGLKTDLFLTPALSVGASFADTSNLDSGYDHVWGADVNYFVTPAVSVGATYVKANAKNGNNLDTDTVGLNASVRF